MECESTNTNSRTDSLYIVNIITYFIEITQNLHV